MTEATPPAPGSPVRVRGEEWAVQKCLPLAMGGYSVHVQGVRELVRHHQAIFVTTIEFRHTLQAQRDDADRPGDQSV